MRWSGMHISKAVLPLFAVSVFVFIGVSCSPPILRPLLEGKSGSAWAGALAIHPAAVSVNEGSTVNFTATGGAGDYSYSLVSGSGVIDTQSGAYQASLTPGIERVRVSDGHGGSAEAQITITATGGSYPDYRIAAAPAAVFPASGSGSTALSGSFAVENVSADPGTASILWSVYLSADASVGPGDLVVDSGSTSPLAPGGVTASIPFSGTWPSAGGSYYLIVVASSSDELNQANNQLASAAIPVTGAPSPDYSFTVISSPATAVGGSALSVPVTFANGSTAGGSTSVSWEVYFSTDTTIDAGDQLLGSGTQAALAAGASSSPTVTGTWPMTAGTAYLIARVSAVDDGNLTNNVLVSSAITVSVPDVEYSVNSVSAPVSAYVGTAINEGFILQNSGTANGSATVNWQVYASPGNQTVGDPGDVLIASGTHGALGGSGSQSIAYTGSWTVPAGSYYLVVQISAADDSNTGNNVTASGAAVTVTTPSPDYQVTLFPAPAGTVAGKSVSGTFTVQNNGTAAGSSPVNWYAYASLGDALYSSGDVLIASGSFGALGVGLTNAPPYNGVWPSVAGNYYVVVVVQAADDPTTTTGSSAMVTVTPPDVNYTVSTMNVIGGTLMPDQTVSGTFQYRNAGTANGQAAQTVGWQVYASLNNTIDASDTLIASGTGEPALAAGATSGDVNWSGVWPLDYGAYYVIIRVTAAEDINSSDNTAVSGSTYQVGYYTEAEPNGDWTNMVQVNIPGVTLKPGMSIHISGSMNNFDLDDIFQFNAAIGTVVVATVSYGAPGKSISLYFFNAPGASGVATGVGITGTDLALQWTVDTSPFWVDFENTGPSNLGAYTMIVSAY